MEVQTGLPGIEVLMGGIGVGMHLSFSFVGRDKLVNP